MKIKKSLFVFVILIACLFLVGCGGKENSIYKVNFNSNGGSLENSIETDGKSVINLPKPTKDGYNFDGWFYDNNTFQKDFKNNSLIDEPITKDLTVYAKWTEIEDEEKIITGVSFSNKTLL